MARSTITKYTSDVSGVEIPEDQLVVVEILHRREHCPGTGDIDEVCETLDLTPDEVAKLLDAFIYFTKNDRLLQMTALEKAFIGSDLAKGLRKKMGYLDD